MKFREKRVGKGGFGERGTRERKWRESFRERK